MIKQFKNEKERLAYIRRDRAGANVVIEPREHKVEEKADKKQTKKPAKVEK